MYLAEDDKSKERFLLFFFLFSLLLRVVYIYRHIGKRTKALAAAARCGQKTIRRLRARRLSAGDIRFT